MVSLNIYKKLILEYVLKLKMKVKVNVNQALGNYGS